MSAGDDATGLAPPMVDPDLIRVEFELPEELFEKLTVLCSARKIAREDFVRDAIIGRLMRERAI